MAKGQIPVFIYIIIPVIFGILLLKFSPKQESSNLSYPHLKVPRKDWSTEMLDEHIKLRMPVLFPCGRNPASNFSALKNWQDLTHFASEIAPELRNVYQSRNANFLYLDYTVGEAGIRKQCDIAGLPYYLTYSVSDMKTKDFFQHCEDKDSYVYYSGKFSAVVKDIEKASKEVDLDMFMVVDPEKKDRNQKPSEDVQLWVGCTGVTASTHYDSSHNLYLQIRGKKRFTIAPPSAAHMSCGIYPDSHPHRRQCQFPNKFGAFLSGNQKDSDSWQVELSPGDLLYLPPYWLHKVETLETSISLSYWSESIEWSRFLDILELPVPFDEGWTRDKILNGMSMFVIDLIGKDGVALLLSSRYNDHVAKDAKALQVHNISLSEMERSKIKQRASEIIAAFERFPENMRMLRSFDYVDIIVTYFGQEEPLFTSRFLRSIVS